MENPEGFEETKLEQFPNGTNFTELLETAKVKYEEFEMDKLPEEIKRNSLDYYYLSVYPGLKEMRELKNPPEYPKEASALYIHIPFCTEICKFCSYFVRKIAMDNNARMTDYFKLLQKEVENHTEHTSLNLKSIYFGGGTPSLVPPKVLDKFLSFLKEKNALDENVLGTLELHPEFFEDKENAQEFIAVIKKYGINRVSIGYQSSNEEILEESKRRHGKEFLEDAIRFLKEHNLSINIDLMYGLPNLSLEDWAKSLRDVLNVNPDSISTYFLFVDKNTQLHREYLQGKVNLPSHEEIQMQHIMAQTILQQHGYKELPNDFYWKSTETETEKHLDQTDLPSNTKSLSVGAGAYGFTHNTQYFNQMNLRRHKEAVESGKSAAWRGLEMKPDTLMRRDIMFSLKNEPNIKRALFVDKYGKDPVEEFKDIIEKLRELNLLIVTDEDIHLTQKGQLVVEEIACQFRDPNITVDEQNIGNPTIERHNFVPTYPKMNLDRL